MSEAMVKPVPRKKHKRPPIPEPPDLYAELRDVLEMFGNTRPYHVLKVGHKEWLIHLSGDTEHTIVKYEGEKPVMIKEGE